jgi:ribosomal protein S27E
VICPHCAQPVFKAVAGGAKLKARTSILVLQKGASGDVEAEINCNACGHGVVLPLVLRDGPFELRKAQPEPRLGLRA